MRFWRRNVPAEPVPEAQEPPAPPAAEEAAELRQPQPVVEKEISPPSPRPEPQRPAETVESAERHAWFWRREAPAQPPPETAKPALPPTDEAPAQSWRAKPEPAIAKPAHPPLAAPTDLDTPERETSELEAPELEAPELEAPELEAPELEAAEPAAPEPAAPEPAAPEPATPAALADSAARRGWLGRLRAGMSRSSARINDGINAIFNRRLLDDEALEELEELLISSDMGTGVAGEVTASLRRTRFNQEVSVQEVRAALAEQVIRLVEPVTRPLRIDRARKPFVILVIGVNGSGKTTTIAKLAKQYRDQGMSVVLAAGDTFRAAAVEQLQIWGERTGCAVVTRPAGSDAAGLAYDALVQARAEAADILLIDTAGRLHNRADLMGELQKIVRVLKKGDAEAPHSVLLVLDATTGQNAHAQAEIFRQMVGVTGIVMTKLDGTARGGVLVSLAEKYGIPIHAIGVGETADDLRPFEARAYARSLVGLEA